MAHAGKPVLQIAAPALTPAHAALLVVGIWMIAMFPPLAAPANENSGSTQIVVRPEIVVRQMIDSIRKLRTTNDPAIRTKLISSIDDSLALDLLSQQALGANWGKLDAAERDRFLRLMRELLEKLAYPHASEFFADLDVQYGREQSQGARRVVPTTVKRSEGGAVSINYVLQRKHGQWQVVDIDLDGQSLAQNVTGQIQAVLR
jgi:ABC-type transporter MlaC component